MAGATGSGSITPAVVMPSRFRSFIPECSDRTVTKPPQRVHEYTVAGGDFLALMSDGAFKPGSCSMKWRRWLLQIHLRTTGENVLRPTAAC